MNEIFIIFKKNIKIKTSKILNKLRIKINEYELPNLKFYNKIFLVFYKTSYVQLFYSVLNV